MATAANEWEHDSDDALFWREHLQRLDDPAKIDALCAREQERSFEAFQRGLEAGDFYESDQDELVWTLERTRRWWAGELAKIPGATAVEREWSARVLAERWF